MDAVIIAGGVPKENDPLYKYTQGAPKALLDLGGKPMVQWIVDALDESKQVDSIIIVGLDSSKNIHSSKPLNFLPSTGGIIGNLISGAKKLEELKPEAKYMAVVSSDIPTIKPEMVDWIINKSLEKKLDFNYTAVERSVMEARFPSSNRTYTKIKGYELSGGDFHVVSIWTITAKEGLWVRMESVRKNPFKQAAIVGFDTLLGILFRVYDLEGASKKMTQKLGFPSQVILSPFAEIGMDVDKPEQYELVKSDLLG